MMYGLTMSIDGSMELFSISNTMIDGIIQDISHYKDKAIVRKSDENITIFEENQETIYFYDKNDRKEKVLKFLDVQ
jgi:hypothetical protein